MRTQPSSQAALLEHPTDSPAVRNDTETSDRQATIDYAILIAPSEGGWRWQVIDRNGASVVAGLSGDQGDAMACAQRAIEFRA